MRLVKFYTGIVLLTGLVRSQQREAAPVEVQMREINLRLDRATVLEIAFLRGQMIPTRPDKPVTFDDATSFAIRITRARIAISARALSDILNQRVFAYPGAPLKNIQVTIGGGRIKQTGRMRKGVEIPFEIEGSLELGSHNDIRFHADKFSAAHIPVKGLLHLFGEDLSKLINVQRARGLSIEKDDIVLSPSAMLSPPRFEGKLTAVASAGDHILLSFDSGDANPLNPPYHADSYIYHRGGVLRFGKLTMIDSDLEIVSESGQRPFDFSLPEYNRQLIAGHSKNTASYGLIVFMGGLPRKSSR